MVCKVTNWELTRLITMNKITPTRGLLDLNVSDISATPETTNDEDSLATEYTLDVPRIPSLQLPLNVLPNPRSVKNAIKMCGGIGKIKAAFKEERIQYNHSWVWSCI